MAFDTEKYNELDDEDKVLYLITLSPNDYSDQGDVYNDVQRVFRDVELSDSLSAGMYNIALEMHLANPLLYIKEISNAIQNDAAATVTYNDEFTRILSAAMVPGGPSYDKNVAYLFARLAANINNRPGRFVPSQAAFNNFLTTGYLDAAKVSGDKTLRNELKEAVGEFLKDKTGEDEEPDSEDAAAAVLAAAESGTIDGASVAQNASNTEPDAPPTEEDVGNYKQCMLMLAFLKRASSFVFDKEEPNNTIWGDTLKTKYTNESHNNRIIPLWCKRPDVFLNACNFNPKFKRYFSRKSTSDNSEYAATLFYVSSTSDDNGAITGTDELELNTNDEDCTLNTINIDYKGTTPATSRKDVKITMTWTLKNFNFLKKDISYGKRDFKFYELITVPHGVAKGSTIGGSSLKTQYSPDYSRVRLKIKSRSNVKEYELAQDKRIQRDTEGKILYQKKDNEVVDDYYVDLAITDHKMVRDDSNKQNVKVTISYRGYFENMLSMPFMDALVSSANLNKRFERDRELNKLSGDCEPTTFREIVRLNRIGDSGETSILNFQEKLLQHGTFYNYTTETSKIIQYIKSGDSRLSMGVQYILGIEPAGNINATQENFDEEESSMNPFASDPEKKIKSKLNSSFCRLGDIMEAAVSQLYNGGSDEFVNEFKHLNLKFVFAPVTIINPFDTSRLINFNPLEMPIDYQFFDQWYNTNVISKKLTYYPILTFIRDLTERVINGILFEACLSARLPDEKPPMLRSGFFYSNRPAGELYQYTREGYYLDLDGYIDSRDSAEKIFQYKKDNGVLGITDEPVTNYCVIYPMNSNFFNLKGGVPMKNSKWIPTFRSGTRFTDGFMTGLTFTQKNQKSGLREAKFFNSGNGLQVMSNVYDFSFTLDNVKPNNMLFPGQLIWFELHDFDNADIDPNTLNTLANVLSMGGYYMIKSVSHTFDIQKGKFTIKYDTLWSGGDTSIKFRRHTYKGKTIETNAECLSAYDKAMERASLVDPTVTGGVTSIGEHYGSAISVDKAQGERIARQIRGTYDYSDPTDRKQLEGSISVYLQSSGDVYKNMASREFQSTDGQYANVQVVEEATIFNEMVATIAIAYPADANGWGEDPGGRYKLNTVTGNMYKER
tara:strand:+ start:3466 stop:6819 length:3354 start_codon:yes stop_codon:yes gene_type:complete